MSGVLLHYSGAVIAVLLSAFGTSIGEGIAGHGSINAMSRQPLGKDQNFRALLIGLALTESGGILSLVMALMLLFTSPDIISVGMGWAHLGVGLAMGLAAASVGIASSYSVKGACESISRQPFFSQKIMTVMLLSQSMIEAPVIFAFVVALLIRGRVYPGITDYEGLKLAFAGLAMGLGCCGPSAGQAVFSHASTRSVGINRSAYQKVFGFSVLSQALIETPVIFCLLISILLIFRPLPVEAAFAALCSYAAAGMCIALASLGAGFGIGYVASRCCYQIARPGTDYGTLFRATLVAQVFIEASAIYGLIISLILIMRL